MKKNQSKLTIACYVAAGLGILYGAYKLYAAYVYLNNYFAAYGASITDALGDAVPYMLEQTVPALAFAALMFMLGVINCKLDAIKGCDELTIEIVEAEDGQEAEAEAVEAAEEAEAAGEAETAEETEAAE